MVYFISDIHLGFLERQEDRKREDLLIAFLRKITHNCSQLYIVGDLFDYWFDYKTVIPKYFYRTLTALAELKESGIIIEYLMGNHDFGHKSFFEKELGIGIHRDDIEREIDGKRFYISHGDGKMNNDTGYKILKSILRNSFSRYLYSLLHPDIGVRLASTSSRKSRTYTDKKDYGASDGLEDFAAKKIADGFDYVIMGHRHKLIKKQIGSGYYVNLGEWLKNPSYAYFDGQELTLSSVKQFLEDS